jgi:integrase
VDEAIVESNPCYRVKVKVPKPLRPAVGLDDVGRLIAGCESVRDKAIVAMFADTGLRLSELASIDAADLHETNTVTVWGKGAKQRVVRFGPSTAALLEVWLRERPHGTAALFGLKPRGIACMLWKLERKMGIKCNAHSFRRTFATETIRDGMNLFHVQSLLGHSSLTMTRVYAEQVNSQDAIAHYRPIVA